MNRSFFTLLLLLFAFSVKSQNAYQDAQSIVRLQKAIANKDPNSSAMTDTLCAILYKYIPGDHRNPNLDSLRKMYSFSTVMSRLIETKGEVDKPQGIDAIRKYLEGRQGTFTPDDQAVIDKFNRYLQLMDSLNTSHAVTRFTALGQLSTQRLTNGQDSTAEIIKKAFTALAPGTPLKPVPEMYVFVQTVTSKKTDTINKMTSFITNTFAGRRSLFEKMVNRISLNSKATKEQNMLVITGQLENKQDSGRTAVREATAPKMALPSESEVIDAVAVYLVNRVKTEASLAFIDLVRHRLQEDSVLLNLFPATRQLLSNSQSYEAPNFGQAWRHAVTEDLTHIPDKLAEDPEITRFLQKQFKINDRFYHFFRLAVKLTSLSRDNASFLDIIDYFHQELLQDAKNDDILTTYVSLLYIINNEFYASGKSNYWITYADFNKLDPTAFEVLLSLLEQKYPHELRKIQVRLSAAQDRKLPTVTDLRQWLSKLFFIINQYQIAVANQAAAKDKLHDISSYWTFLSDSFNQFTSLVNGKAVIAPDYTFVKVSLPEYSDYLRQVSGTFQELTSVYQALESHNYPHVISTTVALMKELESKESRQQRIFLRYFIAGNSEKNFHTWMKTPWHALVTQTIYRYETDFEANPNNTQLLKTDSIAIITSIRGHETELGNDTLTIDGFRQRGTAFANSFIGHYSWYQEDYQQHRYAAFNRVAAFMSDVMATGNSEQLSNVIASYSSPPQSYRLKRASRFSFDLNAYVGLVAGLESFKYPQFSYGLTAPIGVAFSWGGTHKPSPIHTIKHNGDIVYLRGNSNSVSFTILDIGAVVRYRLGSGPSEGLPQKVNFSQFISPALQYHIGIRNTPVDVVVGYQYLPKLREFGNDSQSHSLQAASFAHIGLVFDLPLTNLYHYQ